MQIPQAWTLALLAWAAGPGPAPAQSRPSSAPGTRPQGATITGRVVDALGDPVPSAEVWVEATTSAPGRRASTDGSGMFLLTGVTSETGAVSVSATAEDRIRARTWASLREGARAGAPLELRLWDAGTIRGRVLDETGAPIAGASVIAAYDHARGFGFDPSASATTDEDGGFVLDQVPLGWIQVRAWAPERVLASTDVWLHGQGKVELRLLRGAGVPLTVRITGLPAGATPSIRVLPYAAGGHQVLPKALVAGTVGKDGVWAVTGLPDWEYVVSASAEGLSFEPREHRSKPGKPAVDLSFRAVRITEPSLQLRGRLRGRDGKAIAGETLLCRHYSGGRETSARTEDDGSFVLRSPLAAGSEAILLLQGPDYVLDQTKAGGQHGVHDARFRKYHEFVVKDDAVFELTAIPAAAVRGRVVTPGGEAVPNRRIQLQESNPNRLPAWLPFATTVTDRDGGFVFQGLYPLGNEVRVATGELEAGSSEPFVLAAGRRTEGLVIELPPLGVVEGVVRDAEQKPIPGARVWLRNWDFAKGGQADGSVAEVLTDRAGRYRHVEVQPGGHYLELLLETSHPTFPAAADAFEVKPGERVVRDLQGTR